MEQKVHASPGSIACGSSIADMRYYWSVQSMCSLAGQPHLLLRPNADLAPSQLSWDEACYVKLDPIRTMFDLPSNCLNDLVFTPYNLRVPSQALVWNKSACRPSDRGKECVASGGHAWPFHCTNLDCISHIATNVVKNICI
jgi:hypothetical protein